MESGQLQSKQPRSALAGSYGHPVHPILVTVPIGAWVCSLAFDFVSYGSGDPRTWSVGAMWLVLFGAIGAAVAAVWGVIDYLNLPKGTAAFNTGRIHAALNSTALVIFIIDFIWRYNSRDSWESAPVGPLILSIIGLAIVGASGFLGGRLAYHYGVRVADESVQAAGFQSSAATSTPRRRAHPAGQRRSQQAPSKRPSPTGQRRSQQAPSKRPSPTGQRRSQPSPSKRPSPTGRRRSQPRRRFPIIDFEPVRSTSSPLDRARAVPLGLKVPPRQAAGPAATFQLASIPA